MSYIKALEKLKRQLAEAEAELESRKKPSEDTGPKFVGEGLVIDEWVCSVTFKLLLHNCMYPVHFSINPHFLLLEFIYTERKTRKIPGSTTGGRGRFFITEKFIPESPPCTAKNFLHCTCTSVFSCSMFVKT